MVVRLNTSSKTIKKNGILRNYFSKHMENQFLGEIASNILVLVVLNAQHLILMFKLKRKLPPLQIDHENHVKKNAMNG